MGVIIIKDLGEGIKPKAKWLIIMAITSLVLYLSFKFLLPLVFPFIIAFILALIIRPLTDFLQSRLRFPRILGSVLSMILLSLIIMVGLFYLFNTLFKQSVSFLRNLPIYLNIIADKLDSICSSCDEIFDLALGTARAFIDDHMFQVVDKVRTEVMPGITQQTISIAIKLVGGIGIIIIIFISSVLIAKDFPVFKDKLKSYSFYKDIKDVGDRLSNVGMAYLKAQLIVMTIVAIICVIGLSLIRNEYALLLGILIALMDALPIFGSGIVFIPWSIIMLLNGNIYAAAILISSYLLCLITREVLEPKLISNHIGIKPLFTLMAMYIGVRLFSLAGFILGPIGLIIIITVGKSIYEKTL